MNDTNHMDEKKAYGRALEALKNEVQQQVVALTDEIHMLKIDFQRQKILNEIDDAKYELVSRDNFLLKENDISIEQYDRMLERKRRKLAELKDFLEQLKRL